MKRAALWFLPVLFLACSKKEKAPAPVAAIDATKPAAEGNGPLLWKVDGKAGPVYLYGTIHTGGEAMIPKVAFDALGTTKTFVMEADVENLDQGALVGRAMIADGPTLDEQLGPDLWGKLVKAVPAMIPADYLKKFKPWFATILVIQTMLGNDLQPVDLILKKRAAEQNQAIAYLETVEDQLRAFEQAIDLQALKQLLGDLDHQKQLLGEMLAAYQAGDTAKIEAITTDTNSFTPRAYDLLIKRRNENWIPQLETFAGKGNVFVAVGAGHLVGKDGVVALLRAKGYTVTRVTP